MMIATMNPSVTRSAPVEHRTEPRILLQMTREPENAKLLPTVFIPSLLQRLRAQVHERPGQRAAR